MTHLYLQLLFHKSFNKENESTKLTNRSFKLYLSMYSSEAEFTKSGTFSINDIPAQWKNRITDVFNVNFMRIILMSSFFFLLFFSFNTTQVSK